ncbi:hypothetical protein RBB50_005777, partial [Rhinocladiella similis]
PIIHHDQLVRLCGSNDYVYAQINMQPGMTRYKFLDRSDRHADFVDLGMNVSCTDDPPQSEDGYLYAMYWAPNGEKDIICHCGTKNFTLQSPINVAYFSISGQFVVAIDSDGHIYACHLHGYGWSDNLDSNIHTNSRIAIYQDTFYQSCSIDYWGSVYSYDGTLEGVFGGKNKWTQIDGDNHNRDLVAGPGWLLTRYPNGQTWKWDEHKKTWEALSDDEGGKVTQLVASAFLHIYRLFDDGNIQRHNAGKTWNWLHESNESATYISVDNEHLFWFTQEHKGYMAAHYGMTVES